MAQVAKGKVKRAVGKTSGDDQLEVDGNAEKMKNNLKQAGEKVKDGINK